jgi:hypothetical protein
VSSPSDIAITFAPIIVASAACASRRLLRVRGRPLSSVNSAFTLDPDELAETVWRLYSERTDAVAVVTA